MGCCKRGEVTPDRTPHAPRSPPWPFEHSGHACTPPSPPPPCGHAAGSGALLGLTGRSTRLGSSRWAGPGGSERPVPRVVSTVLPWARRLWGVASAWARPACCRLRGGRCRHRDSSRHAHPGPRSVLLSRGRHAGARAGLLHALPGAGPATTVVSQASRAGQRQRRGTDGAQGPYVARRRPRRTKGRTPPNGAA